MASTPPAGEKPPINFVHLFYPNLGRQDAEKLLQQRGDFLIGRMSEGTRVLSVKRNAQVVHFKFANGRVEIDGRTFDSLEQLVNFHYQTGTMLRPDILLLTPIYRKLTPPDPDRCNKGWARLEPVIDMIGKEYDTGNPLTPFEFPLSPEKRYVIGSRDSDAVSMLVPPVESEDETARLPIEAVILVGKTGQATMERPAGSNANIVINEETLPAGETYSTPLAFDSVISFGPWTYIFRESTSLIDEDQLDAVAEVTRCHVCNSIRTNLHVLRCGHNICGPCRRVGSAVSDGLRFGSRSNVDRTGIGRGKEHNPPFSLESRILQCNVCRSRVTAGAVSLSISSVSGNEMAKALGELQNVEKHRPVCDGCKNTQGLIGARDYDFCEECQQLLCAICTLKNHRKHKLKPRIERLRDLDEVDHKLETAKRTVASLKQLEQEISDAEKTSPINDRKVSNAAMKTTHSLHQKIGQCSRQLSSIQERKRALARGWDETSREMAKTFEQYVREAHEIKREIDRLRNGEASVSLSSSSEENELLAFEETPSTGATDSGSTDV